MDLVYISLWKTEYIGNYNKTEPKPTFSTELKRSAANSKSRIYHTILKFYKYFLMLASRYTDHLINMVRQINTYMRPNVAY